MQDWKFLFALLVSMAMGCPTAEFLVKKSEPTSAIPRATLEKTQAESDEGLITYSRSTKAEQEPRSESKPRRPMRSPIIIEFDPESLLLLKPWQPSNKASTLTTYGPSIEKSEVLEKIRRNESGYVQPELVHEGLLQLARYRTMAKSNMLSCDQSNDKLAPRNCKIIVTGFIMNSNKKAVLACSLIRIQQSIGPPIDCVPLSFSTPEGENWILANITEQKKLKQDVPFFSEHEDYQIDQRATLTEIIASFLRQNPPGMEVGVQCYAGSMTVDAIQQFRASPILQGWREWSQIRFQISLLKNAIMRAESLDAFISPKWEHLWSRGDAIIDLTTTLYVSKNNSVDLAEWHMPTQQQLALYIKYFSNALTAKVGKLCNGQISIQSTINGARFQCAH